MQSLPEIATEPSSGLAPLPVMVPPKCEAQLGSDEGPMVSWMTDVTDSVALFASVEKVTGAITASISRTEVMVLFIKMGSIVFMALYSPVKLIE